MKLLVSFVAALGLGCDPQNAWCQTVTPPKQEKRPARQPISEAKWESLPAGVVVERDAVAGQWTRTESGLHVDAASGARLSIPVAPSGEYDVRIALTRHGGVHSIALIFPHGTGQASFEVDAWGQHLSGIQNISGQSIRENPTRQSDVTLTNDRRHTMTVEVRAEQVRALLDERVVATYRTNGRDLATPDLWALPDRRHMGIGAWESETTFHAIEVRAASGVAPQVAKAGSPMPKEPPASVPANGRHGRERRGHSILLGQGVEGWRRWRLHSDSCWQLQYRRSRIVDPEPSRGARVPGVQQAERNWHREKAPGQFGQAASLPEGIGRLSLMGACREEA